MASKTPDSFFQRLTRLFQSGPAVQRRVKGYDPQNVLGNQMQHGNLTYRTSAPFGFGKDSSQLGGMGSYGIVDRLSRYSDFLSMEYCLSGDTKIPTPYGYKTIKELSEEYGLEKEFLVYSYDVNTMRIVPSHAKQARKTRTDHAWEITFNNGKTIIGTANHRLLKRDGTFCQIENLIVGDSMMPFDRKLFAFDKNKIYRITQQSKKIIKNNLETGRKDITFGRILEVCDKIGFDIDKVCLAFDADPKLIESHLINFGYRDFSIFAKSYTTNPAMIRGMKKDNRITFNNICKIYEPNMFFKDLIPKLGIGSSVATVSKKLKEYGFQNWNIFKKFYTDTKITSIKYYGAIDLYDMTVDGHKNFATDSVISHNTPEIASALDIYCLAGNMEIPMLDGKTSTVKELYLSNKENFHVYSYDIENNKFVPGLCKKVIKTGQNQKIFKITLDDGSYLRLTENHLILDINGVYKKVKELKKHDSLRGLYRDISVPTKINKLKGYEMILQPSGVWKYTHRMVTDETCPEEKGVCHHLNCIKADNRPENLQIMSYKEHQEIHRTLNSTRWKNDKAYAEKMTAIFSAHATKMHSIPGWTKNVFLARRDEVFSSYNEEKRIELFARPGDQNGMYRNGYKLIGDLNGRWNPNFQREFDKEILIKLISSGVKIEEAAKQLNTNVELLRIDFQRQGLEWNKKSLTEFKTNEDILNHFKKSIITFSNEKNIIRKFKTVCKSCNISMSQAYRILNKHGYNNWADFVSKANHKIISIEEDGLEDVYDLQIEKYHNFAAGINGGYTIIHNSDEMVGGDDRGKCFHVYSDNTQIKRALDELFYDVVNVEFNLRPWARNLVKFGDSFIVLEVIPDLGIVNVMPIPVAEIEREEGYNGDDPYAVRFKWITRGNKYLENWQVCHFRILSNDLHGQYGTSVLESSRSIWRKLLLLEDAMLTYRVVRSPERRVFYIDVGNVPPNDVEAYMEAAKSTMKSNGTVDRQTGREDLRYNAQSIMDDFYIPVRGQNQGTKIESLAGGVHNSAVEDVEYMQQKLFAALKIPKPYINFDENISAKAALSQLDIRLSRTVQAYQKILIAELNKMAMIHLYVKGFDGPDLINFELKLSNPSSVALQQKLELWAVKFDIGGTAKETRLVDENWIQKNILELTNEEITQIEKGLRKDQIRIKELEDLELTKPDKSLAPRTTDIFDPSSYDVPGASVPKLPAQNSTPISVNDNSDDSKPSPREIVLSKQRAGGIEQTSELDIKKAPIKATPFLTRYKKNHSRREGISTGTAGTAMPDFAAMLSSQNKYTKDVYGKIQESDTNSDKLSLLESSISDEVKIRTLKDISPDRFNIRIEPILTNNMRSIFKGLDSYLREHPDNKKNLLTENTLNVLDLDDLTIETDGEDLLLEIAEKSITKNIDITIDKVKEKSLTDILSDDEEI